MESRQTLEGEIDPSRPRAQRVTLVFLVGLPLATLWTSAARQLIWHVPGRLQAPIPLTISMTALLLGLLAVAFRYLARNITKFSYDGSTLRFQTSGRPEMEVSVEELSEINPWYGRGRGPGQMLGYRLMFRDRREFFLELRVSNSQALAARLQADRWPEHQPTL
jgi:hypothetical protein